MRIDHVLVAAGGGDGGHAQLDGAHGPLEADLAVLGLALLRDVQLRHDLEALHEGVPVGSGDVEVLHAVAVDAEPHDGGCGLAVGLHVDVGSAAVVALDDHLVGELHHPGLRLVHLGFRLGAALDLVLLPGAQLHDDAAHVLGFGHPLGSQTVAAVDVVEDVGAQADHEFAARGQVHGLDRVLAHEVVGVFDRHHHAWPCRSTGAHMFFLRNSGVRRPFRSSGMVRPPGSKGWQE